MQADLGNDRRSLLRKELAQTRAVRENLRKLSANARVEDKLNNELFSNKRTPSNSQQNVVEIQPSRRTSPGQVLQNSNVRRGGFSTENRSISFEDQLRWFYEQYDKEKLSLVKPLVFKCPTTRDQMLLKFRLLEKYGHIPLNSLHLAWKFALIYAPPTSPCYFCCCSSSTFGSFKNDQLVSGLIRFYERFNPVKLSEPSLSNLVMASRNADEIDVAMIKLKMLLKYQLYPSMSDVERLVSEPTTCCNSLEKLTKSIKMFYLRVHSAKIQHVNAIIDRYGGMERANELKFKLLVKYQFVSLQMEGRSVANRLMFDLNTTTTSDNSEPAAFRLPRKVRPKHTIGSKQQE